MTSPTTDVPAAAPADTLQPPPFAGVWLPELEQSPAAQVDWLWPGYLARGALTLLTSQWKTGKTTLVSLLLTRLAGGPLAGLPVQAARAVVLSEEPRELWRQRHERLHFRGDICFFCRPFATKPTQEQWASLVEHLGTIHAERRLDLVIVDPLSRMLPAFAESHMERMHAALAPLSRLAEQGVSVLLLHHPRKGDVLAGQSARGSGALSAHVDVLMELACRRGAAPDDRVRRLLAWSRYPETVRERVLELSADGLEYHLRESAGDDPFEIGWSVVEATLRDSVGEKLTRQQIHDRWPQQRKPDRVTLWRWLDRAVSLGRLCQEGEGLRDDPYRYWLPDVKDAIWHPDLWETVLLRRKYGLDEDDELDEEDDELDEEDDELDEEDDDCDDLALGKVMARFRERLSTRIAENPATPLSQCGDDGDSQPPMAACQPAESPPTPAAEPQPIEAKASDDPASTRIAVLKPRVGDSPWIEKLLGAAGQHIHEAGPPATHNARRRRRR